MILVFEYVAVISMNWMAQLSWFSFAWKCLSVAQMDICLDYPLSVGG